MEPVTPIQLALSKYSKVAGLIHDITGMFDISGNNSLYIYQISVSSCININIYMHQLPYVVCFLGWVLGTGGGIEKGKTKKESTKEWNFTNLLSQLWLNHSVKFA